MTEIQRFISTIRPADVLDVLVISVLLYVVARWLLHRASWAVAVGLTFILALNLAAQLLSMYLTLAVFRAGAVLIVVVLAIVFQDDIRRGIERLAAWRPGRRGSAFGPMQAFKGTLVEAVAELAERRLGALIVLTGRQPLDAHVRGGVPLHGEPSFPLFLSLFDDRTPGHDGAVVLHGPVVTRFGVHLPLSRNLEELGSRGTRHAAALGLSEWCDAMIIVVSEETGTVSVAEAGKLTNLTSAAQLSERVDAFYNQHEQERSGTDLADRAADWTLKGASVIAACLLWGVFAYRVDPVERTFEDVPVEFRNVPQGWQVEQLEPAEFQLRLTGPERAFDQLDRSALRVSLNMEEYAFTPGVHEIVVPQEAIDLPRGVRLAPGERPEIDLMLDRIMTVESTVQPILRGRPADGYRRGEVSVAPPTLHLRVPSLRAAAARTVRTEAIDLDGADETFTRAAKVRLPAGATLIDGRIEGVQVTVEIVPQAAGPPPSVDESSP